jgi:hypothetical protein
MGLTRQTIHIHPQAPAKVAPGAPCNGCGVCCLAEPCPLGVLLSGRRTGACAALRWEGTLYRCGALVAPREVVAQRLPRGLGWLAPVLVFALRRLGARWIAAGTGCDCHLEVAASPTMEASSPQPTDHD